MGLHYASICEESGSENRLGVEAALHRSVCSVAQLTF